MHHRMTGRRTRSRQQQQEDPSSPQEIHGAKNTQNTRLPPLCGNTKESRRGKMQPISIRSHSSSNGDLSSIDLGGTCTACTTATGLLNDCKGLPVPSPHHNPLVCEDGGATGQEQKSSSPDFWGTLRRGNNNPERGSLKPIVIPKTSTDVRCCHGLNCRMGRSMCRLR